MLDLLKQILFFQKEIPPIHYSYIPSMGYPLPSEYTNKVGSEVRQLNIEWVGLENYSTKVLSNVRIKLNKNLSFAPIVESSGKITENDWSYNEISQEILLNRIDPKESVYISLFPEVSDREQKNRPQIIINDQLLTKPMEWHGFARKHYGFTLITIAILLIMSFSTYNLYVKIRSLPSNDDIKLIDSKLKNYVSCTPYVVYPQEKSVNLEKELSLSMWATPAILQINNVESIEELQNLEKIILCKK